VSKPEQILAVDEMVETSLQFSKPNISLVAKSQLAISAIFTKCLAWSAKRPSQEKYKFQDSIFSKMIIF
jgi:hypothetical protein